MYIRNVTNFLLVYYNCIILKLQICVRIRLNHFNTKSDISIIGKLCLIGELWSSQEFTVYCLHNGDKFQRSFMIFWVLSGYLTWLHSFEAGIAGPISSFKWMKNTYVFKNN